MAAPALSGFVAPPLPRTRLIGREGERAAARDFLLAEAAPLLTLTGPGGVGKTRLTLAIAGDAAGHFADGVVWVDLAPLADHTGRGASDAVCRIDPGARRNRDEHARHAHVTGIGKPAYPAAGENGCACIP